MSNEFRFLGQTIPNLAIISGSILILWGIFSYLSSETGSFTSLIPSFVGLPLLILGNRSKKDKSNKHHYMHASMIIALFSVILTAEDPTNLMIASHLILIVVGTIFMVGGILSFRHARKLRESLGE
jgi:cadmium resistance protein CadD (predicted permease)